MLLARRNPDQALSPVWPALLLFASGVAALIFQILWIKQLSLVVGAEVYAIAIAVSAFFGGLALGGYFIGRRVDRIALPLRFYAGLEACVAVLCIATTLLLTHIAPLFATLQTQANPLGWMLVFGLVGLPAFFMGGTLPALMRAVAPDLANVGRAGGWLYAANTAGAIVGALLPVFLLIPVFGVRGTALCAALLNLVAALAAMVLNGRTVPTSSVATFAPDASLSGDGRLAIGLYAIAGGIALGYEIVWSQSIVQFMSTRSFAFSVVLATYLAGLAAGAAIFSRFAHRVKNPWSVFGLLIAGAGLAAMLEIGLLGPWLVSAQTAAEALVYRWTASEFAGMCARFAVAAASVVLVPTLLLGAAFPAALMLVVRSGHVGRGVGSVVAMNTLGGIAGSLLTGFALLPMLGLVRTLGALAIAAVLVGAAAVFRAAPSRAGARLGLLALGATTILALLLTPPEQLARLLPGARSGALVFYEESHGGTVAVVKTGQGQNRFNRLYIQGVSNSGDAMPSLRYMRLQALLPLLIHNGEPKSALVIGYGTGITAGALSQFPGLERRVVAELLPAVLRAGPQFQGTFGAPTDPGLDVRLHDGRSELQRSPDLYDLITLEPPPPSAAGVVNLYSSEFYHLAGSRLQPGGLVAQWLPLPTQNDEDTRSLVRSFIDVFPHASLWTTELHEMLLVGSYQAIELDVPRIAQRLGHPATAAALSAVGIDSPQALLATWITGREGLAAFAAGALPVTDDRPRIEYATWVRQGEFSRVFAHILEHRTAPPLNGASASFLDTLASERLSLDTFYRAGLSAYAGDRSGWSRQVTRLMQEDDDNPYYRWFIGPRTAGHPRPKDQHPSQTN